MSRIVFALSRPAGFGSGIVVSSSGPGRSTLTAVRASEPTTRATSTGRQRRDGSLPSGKSSTRRTIPRKKSESIHSAVQALHDPPGGPPSST
jgi:hypothetical protein